MIRILMPGEPSSVHGKQIVVTGRFATMTHADLRSSIVARGGHWRRQVTGATDLLAVGQDGPSLSASGSLTRNLQSALHLRKEGAALEILTEDELLDRMGLASDGSFVRRSYSLLELARLLDVPGRTLRAWAERGLIQPVEQQQGVMYFDYSQAAAARSICGLLAAGATAAKLRQALLDLQACLPGFVAVVTQLTMLDSTGRLAHRREDGRLMQPNGQLLLEFPAEQDAEDLFAFAPRPRTIEELFEEALDLEEKGRSAEAAERYRLALAEDPHDPVLHFNLGNVLFALGDAAPAAESYRRAVQLDADYAEAWNNLGNALSHLGEAVLSVEAYKTALRSLPGYPEASFNLAETYFALGEVESAREHWQACLQASPKDGLAQSALERLGLALKK
jgi:tetratricopeptide (TPR) repeat protein